MNNIILIVTEVILAYIALLILYKKYNVDGIYIFAIISTFLSYMLNLKQISILNVSVPVGFGITTALVIALNILIQQFGKEKVNEFILIVLFTSIASLIFVNIFINMTNSEYNLLSNKSFNNIFSNNIRTFVSLTISLLITLYIDSKLYYTIKRIQNKIVYSNIFSIVIIEFFENIIFILFAYLFEYSGIDIALCIIIRYIIKTAIGITGTIPLYIANKIK